MEIIESEEQKEKKWKKTEQNLKDLWNIVKNTNICVVEVPEGEERKGQREYQ